MTVETATYISELAPANPAGASDPVSEGDNHLRLLKEVLQGTFPGANKEFYLPKVSVKTGNYTVVAADENSIIAVDATTAPVTITLPLGSGLNTGFMITVVKTDATGNAVTVAANAADSLNGDANRSTVRRYTMETYQLVTATLWGVRSSERGANSADEINILVFNNTGATLTKGSPVHITGTDAGTGYHTVALSDANAVGLKTL